MLKHQRRPLVAAFLLLFVADLNDVVSAPGSEHQIGQMGIYKDGFGGT